MRALALIDGEHYPPVIRHALEALAERDKLEFVGAVFLGGTEKLASSEALQQLAAWVGCQCAAEQVALGQIAVLAAQYLQLSFGFHAFGDDLEP